MKSGLDKGEDKMARKETIIYDDDQVSAFNLTFPVGTGGHNEKGDVMLLQAMFNFIALGFGDVSKLGIKSRSDLPEVTGNFYGDTGFLILSFQLRWLPILTAQKSGWLVPGYYKDKIAAMEPKVRRQAMFLLHQFAQDAAARLNELDYTVTMLKEFPQLRPFIK